MYLDVLLKRRLHKRVVLFEGTIEIATTLSDISLQSEANINEKYAKDQK